MSDFLKPELPAFGPFGSLGDDDRSMLSALGEFIEAPNGTVLVKEGEQNNFFYFCLSGVLHATTSRAGHITLLWKIQRGGCFGDTEVFSVSPSIATITSVEHSQLWRITPDEFESFINEYPLPSAHLLVGISKLAAERFKDVCDKVARFYASDPIEQKASKPETGRGSILPVIATIAAAWVAGTSENPEGEQVFPVWFGTNRKPGVKQSEQRRIFTNERSEQITYGRVLVKIPEAHRFGETGNSFWKRLLRFKVQDDHLTIQRVVELKKEALFDEVADVLKLAVQCNEPACALIFIHGYNVSFDEAAIRSAQIGYDLKFPGVTAFFSWPSKGTLAAYPADEATIEASEKAITEFLVAFASHSKVKKVHVLAHSMGNRGLLRALQRIAIKGEEGQPKLGQVFLAAPDIDRDVFLDLARVYPSLSDRTTLYASSGDRAVHLSSVLHAAPRAGYFEPYTVVQGIDTVAVPDFDIDLLGHGYFAQAEALLHDIHDLVRHGEPPSRRQRLEPRSSDGMKFWAIRR